LVAFAVGSRTLRTGNRSNAASEFGRVFRDVAFAVWSLGHQGGGIVARGISAHLEPFRLCSASRFTAYAIATACF